MIESYHGIRMGSMESDGHGILVGLNVNARAIERIPQTDQLGNLTALNEIGNFHEIYIRPRKKIRISKKRATSMEPCYKSPAREFTSYRATFTHTCSNELSHVAQKQSNALKALHSLSVIKYVEK